MKKDHRKTDHKIPDIPYEKAKAILARHLCGWICGHDCPVDHMLTDADLIIKEMWDEGIRFSERQTTESSVGGFYHVTTS